MQESQRTHGQLPLLCYSEPLGRVMYIMYRFRHQLLCVNVYMIIYVSIHIYKENTVNECFKSEIDILLLELNKILHLTAMK